MAEPTFVEKFSSRAELPCWFFSRGLISLVVTRQKGFTYNLDIKDDLWSFCATRILEITLIVTTLTLVPQGCAGFRPFNLITTANIEWRINEDDEFSSPEPLAYVVRTHWLFEKRSTFENTKSSPTAITGAISGETYNRQT